MGNVMSLHAEPPAPELRPVAEAPQANAAPGRPAPGTPAPGTPAPGTPAPGTPAQAQQPVAPPTPAPERENVGMSAEEMAKSGAEFASPFEDEYETPAFLRRPRQQR